jgi:hypothetical protein
MQPDLGERAGSVRGDSAEQVRDRPERQIVGFDFVIDGKGCQFGNKAPMAANRPLYEASMCEPIEPAVLPVAGRRGENKGQITRMPGLEETLLEGIDELVGRARANETRARERIVVANYSDGFGCSDDLVFDGFEPLDGSRRKSAMAWICFADINAGACPHPGISLNPPGPRTAT